MPPRAGVRFVRPKVAPGQIKTTASFSLIQPMKANAFCAHPSIRDQWVHEQMSRSGSQFETKTPGTALVPKQA
ncbi:hypothetical protein TNCV_767141 [Trichonephila clavipes]|nr:hypothetical protein TNCV_767141 [Trichonephila clavipes]